MRKGKWKSHSGQQLLPKIWQLWQETEKTVDEKLTVKNWRLTGRLLVCLCLFGVLGSSFAQVVLLNDALSQKIQLGKNWYGEKYQITEAAADNSNGTELWGNMTLELIDFTTLPKAKVIIDGKVVGDFARQQVTVRVEGGDVVEVDTAAYSLPVTVKIKSVSSIINTEKLNEFTTIKNGRATIGKIFFK